MEQKKVFYVLCPAYVKTGGTELLHQLVKELRVQGKNACMAYTEISDKNPGINPAFLEYIDDYVKEEEIEDKVGNTIIVPEIYCPSLEQYRHLKKYIWWLSVDNYLSNNSFADRARQSGLPSAGKALIQGKLRDKTELIGKADLHLCQSHYAMDYLAGVGIGKKKIRYLSDYVNDIYLEQSEKQPVNKKKDVVLYNPKKGAAFTKKLIQAAPQLHWTPLINLSTDEVLACMRESKVYIDFGNHPGKDRIPREAAVAGCVIITGKRGSAGYAEDVRIPEHYKFDEKTAEKKAIIDLIVSCMEHYEEHSKDFEDYRNYIKGEKEQFKKDVHDIFA